MFDTLVKLIEHIRSGELRALGVTAAARAIVLSKVPAIGEELNVSTSLPVGPTYLTFAAHGGR